MSLLRGLNHAAVLTADLERFIGFYSGIFEAAVAFRENAPLRHAILNIGGDSWLHPIEAANNPHARALSRMFERGHLDHVALTAASGVAFQEIRHRLVRCGASDGAVDDMGPFRTLSFEDPDGMRGELTLIIDSSLRGIHAPRRLDFASIATARTDVLELGVSEERR